MHISGAGPITGRIELYCYIRISGTRLNTFLLDFIPFRDNNRRVADTDTETFYVHYIAMQLNKEIALGFECLDRPLLFSFAGGLCRAKLMHGSLVALPLRRAHG